MLIRKQTLPEGHHFIPQRYENNVFVKLHSLLALTPSSLIYKNGIEKIACNLE